MSITAPGGYDNHANQAAVFPQSLIPSDLVQIPSAFGLPPLGDVDFSLVDNPSAAREPVEALASAIMGRPVQKLTPLES